MSTHETTDKLWGVISDFMSKKMKPKRIVMPRAEYEKLKQEVNASLSPKTRYAPKSFYGLPIMISDTAKDIQCVP